MELPEAAKPFKDDPVKQERFERFLKDKYLGGLRSTESGGASDMSEAARARERLDFEAAAEGIQKAKLGKESLISTQKSLGFPAAGGMKFTSAGIEVNVIWRMFISKVIDLGFLQEFMKTASQQYSS